MHKRVYGEEHEEPIFLAKEQPWGHIPAMKGYKNYEHYMKYWLISFFKILLNFRF